MKISRMLPITCHITGQIQRIVLSFNNWLHDKDESTVPHDTMWAEMGADPSLMEALFQLVTSIQEAHFIHFMDMDKKRSTPSKRMGIYLHEDLTSSSSTCKENMAQVLDARKEGKRVGYRDGNIMMIQKSHMTMYGLWEFTHDYMELQFRSLRISAKYFGDTYK